MLLPPPITSRRQLRGPSLTAFSSRLSILLVGLAFVVLVLPSHLLNLVHDNGGTANGGGSTNGDADLPGGLQHRQHAARKDQRLVLLVGPHKAASTSVQSFLFALQKQGILGKHGWEWTSTSPKGFRYLRQVLGINRTDDIGVAASNETTVEERLRRVTQSAWDRGQNIVLGAEVLDLVAALTEEEAGGAIRNLWDWLPAPRTRPVEVVVMYRTPRRDHLISAWKQQVGFQRAVDGTPWRTTLDESHRKRKDLPSDLATPPSFARWLCDGTWPQVMKFDVSRIFAAQINPFGVANAYHVHGGANLTILDMAGTDGDIPSVVVCDVLNLPCTAKGRLEEEELGSANIDHEAVMNKREIKSSLEMADDDLKELEDVIRSMDCYYFCRLGGQVNILYGKDEVFAGGENSWRDCCRRASKEIRDIDAAQAFRIIRELSCRALNKR